MADTAGSGWYHAEGDPPGTERFWDGSAWTEGPRPVGGASSFDAPSTETPAAQTPDADGFGMSTPSTPDDSFGMSTPSTPQDSFGSPSPEAAAAAGGFASSTPSSPTSPSTGFPGAPGAMAAPQFGNVYPEESKAQTALIIAVVGIILCGPVAIIGGVMGNTERKAIDEGRRDPANKGMATAALVIGAIAAIITILIILFVVFVVIVGVASS